MNRRSLFFRIAIANVVILFFFVNFNDFLTRRFNPDIVETLSERLVHSFQPLILASFIVAASTARIAGRFLTAEADFAGAGPKVVNTRTPVATG